MNRLIPFPLVPPMTVRPPGCRRTLIYPLICILLALMPCLFPDAARSETTPAPGKKWKILHIMSYHSPWKWTDEQFNGFKAPLAGLDIEYRVFQMDTKRRSDEAWIQRVGKEARDLIDSWKPDLVYTSDDYAQEYVATYYLNQELAFVFSGVNADPEKYGFRGSKNITGVLEQEHFVETVKLLKQMVPSVKKLAVIYDDDPTWDGVLERMKKSLANLSEVQVVSWNLIKTFKEYREKMTELQDQVDAVGLLGIFTFKDERGRNVSYKEVLRWTLEHSRLPDFSFWKDRVSYGTLCVVSVSEYEQGLAAGKIARGILLEGRSPADYAMEPTVKGEPLINLFRAKKLGLNIRTSLLLSATVIDAIKQD